MNVFSGIGRVGKDAEIRFISDGKAVTSWSMAFDTGYGDNKQTTWIRCTAWGDRFTKIAEYITKGSQLGVIGEISLREYETNGEKRQSLELKVSEVKLLGGKSESTPRTNPKSTEYRERGNAPAPMDSDIPF